MGTVCSLQIFPRHWLLLPVSNNFAPVRHLVVHQITSSSGLGLCVIFCAGNLKVFNGPSPHTHRGSWGYIWENRREKISYRWQMLMFRQIRHYYKYIYYILFQTPYYLWWAIKHVLSWHAILYYYSLELSQYGSDRCLGTRYHSRITIMIFTLKCTTFWFLRHYDSQVLHALDTRLHITATCFWICLKMTHIRPVLEPHVSDPTNILSYRLECLWNNFKEYKNEQ